VICAIAGEWGKLTRQPRDLIPIRRNQSRKVETVVLKWVMTKRRNREYRGLTEQRQQKCQLDNRNSTPQRLVSYNYGGHRSRPILNSLRTPVPVAV
jgi:hypothetical protein